MNGPSRAHALGERRFYSGMIILVIAILFVGFAPSFYLRGLVHVSRPNPTLSALVLLHGVMFSVWMLLFLIQARLVALGRRDLHIKLGRWSMAFAVALVPLMIATTIGQVARANQPPGYTPLGWSAVPAFAIPVFVTLVWAGWHWRRDPQAHKRLMLAAAILMADPGMGRIPIFPDGQIGIYMSDAAGWSPFLALFVWDIRSRRGIHWATWLGAGMTAACLLLREAALVSPAWERFAGAVVALAGG